MLDFRFSAKNHRGSAIQERADCRIIEQRESRFPSVADTKQDEGFKVVDRRHFTESGDLREGAVEQERREEAAAAKAARAQAALAAKAEPVVPPHPAAEPPGETIAPSRGFQTLVDFLTRNAAAMMGGMADPQTGQAYVDLEGAREVIDMLDALRDKTRGNLAKADDDLIMEVVGSLKLTFMEISKAAAEAMAKKNAKK
jgi:uncharacterized protein DUF1844